MANLALSLSVKHNFAVTGERIGQIPDALDRAMQAGTRRSTDYLADAYRREIPKRTGHTAGTIQSVIEPRPGGATGYVGTDDEIAKFLEYGTKPHRIQPRNAKALKFEVGNKTVFAKYVNHPGTRAHESLLKAGAMSTPLVERFFSDEVGDVLR